jgi:hypothetical protein
MWSHDFSARLAGWHHLRQSSKTLPVPQALHGINQWWFQAPWSSYYLHWDDQDKWPDPWQLLSDNIFCEVARGLGMLYTITMIEHPEITDSELIETPQGTLVRVHQGKYILNWYPDTIVNISPESDAVRHRLHQTILESKL